MYVFAFYLRFIAASFLIQLNCKLIVPNTILYNYDGRKYNYDGQQIYVNVYYDSRKKIFKVIRCYNFKELWSCYYETIMI